MSGDKLMDRIESYLWEKSCRLFPTSPDLDNPEIIHRMRVASRRLRVGLEFFTAIYDSRELKQILQQLRRLTRALGAIRVLDVNLDHLRKASVLLPPDTTQIRLALERQFTRERQSHQANLEALLRASQVSKLPSRIKKLVTRPSLQLDDKRILRSVTDQLAELRRTLRKRLLQFDQPRGHGAFHKLRIAAKKYRYGLEMAHIVFDADTDDRLEPIETLQELMGTCHDIEVLTDHLIAARKNWQTDRKDLARTARHLINFFQEEHQRHYDRVKKFLKGKRPWLKRIKLKRPPP